MNMDYQKKERDAADLNPTQMRPHELVARSVNYKEQAERFMEIARSLQQKSAACKKELKRRLPAFKSGYYWSHDMIVSNGVCIEANYGLVIVDEEGTPWFYGSFGWHAMGKTFADPAERCWEWIGGLE